MSRKIAPPRYIYCPRCGEKIALEPIDDPRITEEGYVVGARGICTCGVVAVLCIQEMPKSPTFSLFFDVYKAEEVRKLLYSKT